MITLVVCLVVGGAIAGFVLGLMYAKTVKSVLSDKVNK